MAISPELTNKTSSSFEQERRATAASNRVQGLDQIETHDEIHDEENNNRGIGALHGIRSKTRTVTHEVLITWDIDDPENPYNWPHV